MSASKAWIAAGLSLRAAMCSAVWLKWSGLGVSTGVEQLADRRKVVSAGGRVQRGPADSSRASMSQLAKGQQLAKSRDGVIAYGEVIGGGPV